MHLPVIDRIFGTQYLPRDRWPEAYGLAGAAVPADYWSQLAYPFRRTR